MACFKYIVIALPLLLNGCCTKEDCVVIVTREITFKFNRDVSSNGFTENELDSLVVILQNPTTGEVIDSSRAGILLNRFGSFMDSVAGFNEIGLNRVNKTARGANIILMLPGGSYSDTMFNIQFENGVHEFSCGSCFLEGRKETEPFIANRSLTYRGQLKTEGDFPVVVSKK